MRKQWPFNKLHSLCYHWTCSYGRGSYCSFVELVQRLKKMTDRLIFNDRNRSFIWKAMVSESFQFYHSCTSADEGKNKKVAITLMPHQFDWKIFSKEQQILVHQYRKINLLYSGWLIKRRKVDSKGFFLMCKSTGPVLQRADDKHPFQPVPMEWSMLTCGVEATEAALFLNTC